MEYIYIKNDTNFKFDDLKKFKECLTSFVEGKYKYVINVKVDKEDLELFSDYYKNVLIL